MNTRHLVPVILASAAVIIFPHAASAQQARSTVPPPSAAVAQGNVPAPVQNAAADAEDVARRFGAGIKGGVGLDPELIDFGAHATFGPIFNRGVSFRPGIEFGLGEVTTLFAVNLDVLYRFPGVTGRWTPYVGAGPNFTLSHRGFETEASDHVTVNGVTTTATTTTTTGTDTPSRFDFSDTDFTGGFNFIAGARSRSGAFFELNATAYGVSNVRLLAGFDF